MAPNRKFYRNVTKGKNVLMYPRWYKGNSYNILRQLAYQGQKQNVSLVSLLLKDIHIQSYCQWMSNAKHTRFYTGSHETLGLQVLVLIQEVEDPWRGEAYMKELSYYEWAYGRNCCEYIMLMYYV